MPSSCRPDNQPGKPHPLRERAFSCLLQAVLLLLAGGSAAGAVDAAVDPGSAEPIYLYLAGPGVFLADAAAYGAARKARVQALAAERAWPVTVAGLYPLDNEIENFAANRDTGLRIYRANMAQIDKADAVVANMVRFRSPSMDVGTAFEMGVARGMRKPVFAYYDAVPFYGKADFGERPQSTGASNDFQPPSYASRVRAFYDLPDARPQTDPHGLIVEDFAMTDNLMLLGALDDSQTDLAGSFDAAVVNAVEHVLTRRREAAARRADNQP